MSELLSARRGHTLELTLDRAEKMNALSASLVDALLTAVNAACEDGTRLLVLRGNGKNFSAGFDMAGVDQQSEGDLLLRFVRLEQLLQAVHHAPFETLVLAHGRNFGAGVDLIGACSRRLATADATFRMPGLKFGLALGTHRFALQVGGDIARDILAESKTFGAEEGRRIGFLTGIAEASEWPAAIERAAAAATALAPDAHARLVAATRMDTRDADLAELVRSAAAPGIRQRIAEYLAPAKDAAPAKAGARSSKD
ncbi:MAG TPA: enoyl-CoA hydratase/isomerase family protein [Usitatibacter sp.]|nr:enoyl-CoA hydratase/isomerase family protein [Usitatibacter sp.]